MRSAESLLPQKLQHLQQELMKSLPLSSKLAKIVDLLYSESRASIDTVLVRRLLAMLGNIPKEEEALHELILCFLQKL